jgi:energy-coupling factor transporter ATP-binding protein EcfA2
MKLTQIEVENFLGIHSISVKLDTPITLFAGPNGAGKSSIREAVRMAMTGEPGRVSLKKEFDQLVCDGSKAGGAQITVGAGEAYAFNVPAGKFSITEGLPSGETVDIALNGQRFASMAADARRTFLFGLTGCKVTADEVRKRLAARNCDATKIEAVLPMLRTGFPSAQDLAKDKARDAKGAWRGLTGETYGEKKAEIWKAEKPAALDAAGTTAEDLAALDTEMAGLNKEIGALFAKDRAQTDGTQKRLKLKAVADELPRRHKHLETVQADLVALEPQVVALRERARGTKRVGLIHDMAYAIAGLVEEAQPHGIDRLQYVVAVAVLDLYEAEHGELQAAGEIDQDAKSALPEYERGLEVLQTSAKNAKRDVTEAESAVAALAALEEAIDFNEDYGTPIAQLQARLTTLKASRDTMQAALRAIDDNARQIAQADKLTAQAGQHHADVLAWGVVADALAPDGIPGEILAEALKPINATLQMAATDTGWMKTEICADMGITAAGRPYALLSESEQWRVDAMIAQAIAKLSGLKILMLDRVDVLDLAGRSSLLNWLDQLAEDGDIETALLFATLKGLPAQIPPTVAVHWIEAGAIKEFKVAA